MVETRNEFNWTWRTDRAGKGEGGSRDIRVVLSERGEQTLLRIEERNGSLAGGLFGGLVGGIGGGGGVGLVVPIVAARSPLWIPLAMLLWVGAVFVVVRHGFRSAVLRRYRELHRLASEIETVTSAAAIAPSEVEES